VISEQKGGLTLKPASATSVCNSWVCEVPQPPGRRGNRIFCKIPQSELRLFLALHAEIRVGHDDEQSIVLQNAEAFPENRQGIFHGIQNIGEEDCLKFPEREGHVFGIDLPEGNVSQICQTSLRQHQHF
jgi:hypothetical protein